MIVIKAKYFDHSTRQWEYLQEDGADVLFDSHPDAQDAVMRRHPRAYNEDEFDLEIYIVCECGTLILRGTSENVCPACGEVYDCWGNRFGTSSKETYKIKKMR